MKLLLTVESVFDLRAFLTVEPAAYLKPKYIADPCDVAVELRRPDGSQISTTAVLMAEHNNPGGYRVVCTFADIPETDIPIGTEIWIPANFQEPTYRKPRPRDNETLKAYLGINDGEHMMYSVSGESRIMQKFPWNWETRMKQIAQYIEPFPQPTFNRSTTEPSIVTDWYAKQIGEKFPGLDETVIKALANRECHWYFEER